MNNKCEKEYIEKVDRLIIDLKFELNNPPQSMKLKDSSALNEANKNIDGASQKMNNLKSGGIMLGAGAGVLVGAKIGISFGPYAALAGAIIGAVAGGLIGAGLANILIDVLKMLDNTHIQWERAYGITRTGVQ